MNIVVGDESEEENEEEGNIGKEGEGDGDFLNYVKENFFRVISTLGKRPKIDIDMFVGNLNPDELIDQINELEEYFEYEDIKDPNRVNFLKEKIKGHAKFLWQEIQLERNNRGKEKYRKMGSHGEKRFIW